MDSVSLPFIRPKHIRPSSEQQAGPALPARRKTSLACSNCRAKRSRCDNRKPFCSECVKARQRCVYENSDKRKKETWKAAISNLEQKNRRLEAIVRSLRCNSLDKAVETLRQLRENGHELDHAATPRPSVGSDTGSSDQSPTQSPSPRPKRPVAHMQRSRSSITIDHDPTVSVGPFGLPPREITRRAVSSFFSCGGTLFYIMPREDCESMIETTYDRPEDATRSVVGQICAVAVVGSHYCTDDIPASAKEKYFDLASSLLHDDVEDDLSIMRVHACLSIYLILLKSTTARAITASGLNIARYKMPVYTQTSSADWRERAKVTRTLSFIECWLSSTLGYKLDLRQDEIKMVNTLAMSESMENPTNQLCPNLIRWHAFKIAYLSAQVYDLVHSAASVSIDDLQQLSLDLDTWLLELPNSMRLDSLITADDAASENFDAASRPILFLHMIHITSRIMLYERVMHFTVKQSLNPSDELVVREVLRLPADTHQTYQSFAQHLARLIRLLYDKDCVLARCWLTINACYHSSIVLLLNAAKNLALVAQDDGAEDEAGRKDRPDLESVFDNLVHVRFCLQALGACEDWDIAAMRLVDVVKPLYERLRQAVEMEKSQEPDQAVEASKSPYSMPDLNMGTDNGRQVEIPARLAHIMHQSVAAMKLPYQEVWV
ncbi:uncharacterized protein DSM5745_02625 [Aspergillus mulundensis]|uniref:Zn(2)-C6 fungal-type domain-containing protein n=1 Tax=Aspergillus mulundensis TaxID=1810919 RepID=A0A3D8SX54_9EURO|nr:hypothetical protein DSM5745_02625 [Aspergillus mulundensis]RDW90850.1 hypothetical protein DSM5745_02625 [Aspergillus mulundensis]